MYYLQEVSVELGMLTHFPHLNIVICTQSVHKLTVWYQYQYAGTPQVKKARNMTINRRKESHVQVKILTKISSGNFFAQQQRDWVCTYYMTLCPYISISQGDDKFNMPGYIQLSLTTKQTARLARLLLLSSRWLWADPSNRSRHPRLL